MIHRPVVSFEPFRRANAAGERIIYVRFFDEAGAVIATRSTGCTEAKAASFEISRLLAELDFAELAAARTARKAHAAAYDTGLGDLTLAAFFRWYWSEEGLYVKDRRETSRALASDYLRVNHHYLEAYVLPYPAFTTIPLRQASFLLVDGFFRWARKRGRTSEPGTPLSRDMFEAIRNVIRGPLNWAAARGLCKKIDFKGIVLPERVERERGIISDDEIHRLLALPVQQLWREASGENKLRADVKPRPRRAGGEKVEKGSEPVDIRMKAFVLMGPYLGFRRGEERGLRWRSVDLKSGLVKVENNYVRGDGDKRPKADSFGIIPIAPELEVVLWELKEFAKALGLDSPDDYVLFNPRDTAKPASEKTLRRGWDRSLRMIGISEDERKRRNLVPHGTRHRFATKLVEAGIDPRIAQRFTRHKTLAMLARYSDHISTETMAQAMEAIRGRPSSRPHSV